LYRAPLIAELPFGHRQVLTFRDAAGVPKVSQLLAAGHAPAQIPLPGSASEPQPRAPEQTSLSGFFLLGMEHILIGYDHLLFLFALLLVCPNLVTAAKIITCFTLAHSLTLALATFDLVQMPGSVVEPLIAASIIYVAVENIVSTHKLRWRYALTFAFGLIHGLGFAGILRELGVGSSGAAIAGPLLTFNLGVELGQLAVAAVVLPLLLGLRRNPLFLARGVPAFSIVVAGAGAYWLLQRTFLQSL
jgi:hydrogenase/urease accessory protein HupE